MGHLHRKVNESNLKGFKRWWGGRGPWDSPPRHPSGCLFPDVPHKKGNLPLDESLAGLHSELELLTQWGDPEGRLPQGFFSGNYCQIHEGASLQEANICLKRPRPSEGIQAPKSLCQEMPRTLWSSPGPWLCQPQIALWTVLSHLCTQASHPLVPLWRLSSASYSFSQGVGRGVGFLTLWFPTGFLFSFKNTLCPSFFVPPFVRPTAFLSFSRSTWSKS